MKDTKVIFFGTSDRSTPILDSLKSNFNLCLCVTKKDTKIGRKQIEKETGVKKWCKDNNVIFIEIDSLKENNLSYVLEEIENIKPDIGIVADFSYIIPKSIIESLKGQIINVHFSLLPKYRGASPVQYAILNGDEYTGVTYYLLSEKMDDGNILSQLEYKIYSRYTSGELYDLLFKFASENLPDVIKKYLSGEIKPVTQDHSLATYTYSKTNPKHTFIFKEDALIDWGQPVEKIERSVRAFNPWPISWGYLKDLENAKCLYEEIELKDHVDKNLKVKIYKSQVIDGKLKIDELQVEGKNKLGWKEFKNGYTKTL